MPKKLKTAKIANELKQSTYFKKPGPRQGRSKQRKRSKPIPTTPKRPQELKTPKRIIVRSSFDIYEDQQISLQKIKTAFKEAGEKRGVSDLMRESLDGFIKQMNK